MARKSWQLDRRDMIKGAGIALALPMLDSMTWAAGIPASPHPPKRMIVTYISYGGL